MRKLMSLTKFRADVATIDEVVEVARRDEEGNTQIMGYWTPYMIAAMPSHEIAARAHVDVPFEPDGFYPLASLTQNDDGSMTVTEAIASSAADVARSVHTPASAVAVAKRIADPVRAVPKPSAKRR